MSRDRMLPPRVRRGQRAHAHAAGHDAGRPASSSRSSRSACRSTVLLEFVNIGTLSAFVIVCAGVMVLRFTHPRRRGRSACRSGRCSCRRSGSRCACGSRRRARAGDVAALLVWFAVGSWSTRVRLSPLAVARAVTDDTLAARPSGSARAPAARARLRDLIVVAAAAMGPAFSLATTMAAMIAAAGRWTWLALAIVAVLMAMIAARLPAPGRAHARRGLVVRLDSRRVRPAAGAYGAWVLLVANLFAVLATALPAGTYTLDLVAPALAANALAVALVGVRLDRRRARCCCGTGCGRRRCSRSCCSPPRSSCSRPRRRCVAGHPRPDAVAFAPAPLAWGGLVGAIVRRHLDDRRLGSLRLDRRGGAGRRLGARAAAASPASS